MGVTQPNQGIPVVQRTNPIADASTFGGWKAIGFRLPTVLADTIHLIETNPKSLKWSYRMNNSNNKAMTLLAAGALVLVGYFLGSMNGTQAHAQNAAAEPRITSGALGVSIPSGGAAVLKGSDGNAYIVSQRGLYTKVSQAGKDLPLD